MQPDGAVPRSRFVGFDGLRLVAALSVIFSHAFLIATGSEDGEPLVRLLGHGHILGLYGVFTFFIISGFLLARSLAATPQALVYAVNRTLRIAPGFVACVVVTGVIVGPVFSAMPVREYFARADVANYVWWCIASLGDSTLAGLFNYEGASASVINGSLWSLRYEVWSYVLLLVIWLSLRSHTRVATACVLLSILVWTAAPVERWLVSVEYTLPYFSAGVAMAWWHARYGTSQAGAVVSAAALIVSAALGVQVYAFALFGAYLIVYFGERHNLGSRIAAVTGDCSYGLYLYGWPVEQMVKQSTGTGSAFVLFALATPLAFACAVASHRLVELPAMRGRKPVLTWISRAIARVFGERVVPASWGAMLGFIVSAGYVLTDTVRWWYVVDSFGFILFASAFGAVVAAAGRGAMSLISEPSRSTYGPGMRPRRPQ